MRRGSGIVIAAALAFAAVLIARLPVGWFLPAAVQRACAAVDGSLWNGTCVGLTLDGTALGNLTWTLRPARLLAGRLAAHVALGEGPVIATGDVEWAPGGRVTARDLVADAPLDPKLIPGIPAKLSGDLHLELATLDYQSGALTGIKGRIEARDLEDRSRDPLALGSYRVEFPGAPGAPLGTLHDLGGPLAVDGTLRVTTPLGVELAGSVAPRPQAAPALVSSLRFLGPADAAGRRPFSLAANF